MSHASRPDDARDGRDDDERAAVPSWVRATPIRPREWWTAPVLLTLLAVVCGVVPTVVDLDAGTVFTGQVAAAAALAGAAALAVYGRRAYREQERGASWDLHRARVVVLTGTLALVAVLDVVLGAGLLITIVLIAPVSRWQIQGRDGPRFDHVVVVVAGGVVLVVAIVLGLLAIAVPGAADAGPVRVAGLLVFAPALIVLLLLELVALRAGRFPRR